MSEQKNHEMHENIKMFHDRKTPDFDLETNVVFGAGEKGHLLYHAYEESVESDKTIGETSVLEDIILISALTLKNVELKNKAVGDVEQMKLLNRRKEIAIDKIKNLLDDVLLYTISINALDTVKVKKEDFGQQDYLGQLEAADRYRKQRHNALIQSLQSTIRYIQYNFGNISEKAIEKWEEEQEEKNIPIIEVQRVTFSPNVVCPENIDLENRKQIMAWAVQLSLVVGELKKRLS